MFGVTTPCVTRVREQLEASGYDVLVFHATGSGGRAMEGLIDDGYFHGLGHGPEISIHKGDSFLATH